MRGCTHAHVARKQRVEVYLDRDDVDGVTELAKRTEQSSSGVIREAVQEKLDREL